MVWLGLFFAVVSYISMNKMLRYFGKNWLVQQAEFEWCRDQLFNEYRLTISSKSNNAHLYQYCTRSEPIPVLCEDGNTIYMPWLGFILREEAELILGEYVTLNVTRITWGVFPRHYRDLKQGEQVQGWLVANGVYAVTDNVVAISDVDEMS